MSAPLPPLPAQPSLATPSRRGLITGAAALAAAGYVAPAYAGDADRGHDGGDRKHARLTILGTTDVHGHVVNWDYYKNAEYDDAMHNDVGLAKLQTLIKAMRAKREGEPLLMLDAGDIIQGTPLAFYYARIKPIDAHREHPMAKAMNLMGYDAATLGNHEFNYGLKILRRFQSQLNFPLMGANAIDPASKLPVFPPYIIKDFAIRGGPPLRVGVLGLTNPGIAIWDKANVSGKVEFPGLVQTARKWVKRLKKKGCDLVIVSAHSGEEKSSSYGDALPYPENASGLTAKWVPHIDAMLVGHTHLDLPQTFIENKRTGQQVLLCEPDYWGMRLAVMELHLERHRHGWRVEHAHSQTLNSNTVDEDPKVAAAVRAQHKAVVRYVNSVVGTSTTELSAARAPVQDVPIIDFINYVQADAVKQGLTGGDTGLPTLSIAAPFNRQATFPAGNVTIRDVAGLYIYDNTLLGVKVTGKDVKDYLEYSAIYFQQVSGTGPFTMDQVTNAKTAAAPQGTPDYNFDSIRGLDAHLTYDIDIAQPVGSRIKNLSYAGAPIDPTMEFAMAVNNYRQSGGGGFPAVSTAPVVYNRQIDIRQLLIDWVTAHKTIDPTTFASVDWQLVANGQPITVT